MSERQEWQRWRDEFKRLLKPALDEQLPKVEQSLHAAPGGDLGALDEHGANGIYCTEAIATAISQFVDDIAASSPIAQGACWPPMPVPADPAT